MSVIALTSTRSSPGVSSLAVALGLVWQRQGREPLLVEADPAGGVQGLRFDLAAEPSLATLTADLRRGYESSRFVKNAVDLLGVRSLLAPADPLTAWRVLQRNGPALAEAIRAHGHPTVIDVGRIDHHSPALPLAKQADRVLLVTRPRAEDVQSLLYGCRLLRGHQIDTALVVVGDHPYNPAEVAELADLPLAAVIPDNRQLAVAFSGGRYSGRRLRRSLLWRSIQDLADMLLDGVGLPSAPMATPAPRPAAVPAPKPDLSELPAPTALPADLGVPSMAPPDPSMVTAAVPAGLAPERRTVDASRAWPPPVRAEQFGELASWQARPRGVTS